MPFSTFHPQQPLLRFAARPAIANHVTLHEGLQGISNHKLTMFESNISDSYIEAVIHDLPAVEPPLHVQLTAPERMANSIGIGYTVKESQVRENEPIDCLV